MGFTGNTNPAGPEIVLSGSLPSFVGPGLLIFSSGNVLRELVIKSFPDHGILISGPQATGNVVAGCFIGVDANGTANAGNGLSGVLIGEGANNRVGGIVPSDRNLISGNGQDGVNINSDANGNKVEGNLIGTDVTGTIALGNVRDGVNIESSSDNIVGGPDTAARNIISGNLRSGVFLVGGASIADHNLVQNNFIGMDVTGTVALSNLERGVSIVSNTGTNVRNSQIIGNPNLRQFGRGRRDLFV